MGANKRVSVAEKAKLGMGAEIFYQSSTDTQPQQETVTDTQSGTEPLPDTQPNPSPEPSTNKDTGTLPMTGTSTGTSPLLDELDEPDTTMVRHVVYIEQEDSEWIKKLAKKKKKKESAIFRMAIKVLRKELEKK